MFKTNKYIFLLTVSLIIFYFIISAFQFAQAAPDGSTPNWKMPELQIKIPGIEKFSAPTQCDTDEQGNIKYCIPWIGQYIAGIYQYAIGIVGILSAVVLMFGGIIWLTAGGNATQIGNAKSWIGASLTGLVIALCSYMILYTVNPALTIFKPLQIQLAKTEGDVVAPKAGALGLGEGEARTMLTQASQSAGSHGIGVKPPCPTNGPYTGCVNLQGVNSATLNEVINLSKNCAKCTAYEVFITGGTEPGHSENGSYTHTNGYKVDLRPSNNIDTYIKTFAKIGTRSDGSEQWQAPSGAIYAYEKYGDPHWDVTVK